MTELKEQSNDKLNVVFKERAIDARLAVFDMWKKMGFEDDEYRRLKQLLGLDPNLSCSKQFTEDHIRLCQMLVGPHGPVILKALQIKRGLK